MSTTTGHTLHTTTGESFTLGKPIGRGGQAAVYAIKGHDGLCAKVYKGVPANRVLSVRHRLDTLRRLDGTANLVLPQKVFEVPDLGYIMERVPSQARPLSHWAVCNNADVAEFYAETGGLRERLLVGIELARAFGDLHARGLAYGDLSFDNLLLVGDRRPELRLIDCDNLTVDGVSRSNIQGTPWFIAPEVLSGTELPSQYSDAWSLAVLLYHLLVLTHPLLGDTVRSSEPAAEEAALAGRKIEGGLLPWVDHPDDKGNRTKLGLPRGLVLSKKLQQTFRDAFEAGLVDPHRRPSEGRWLEVLHGALDATMSCPKCRNTCYLAGRCPWCNGTLTKPAALVLHHGDGRRPMLVESARYLYPRHLRFRGGGLGDEPLALVRWRGGNLEITPRGDSRFNYEVDKEWKALKGNPIVLPPGHSFRLRLPAEETVRVTIYPPGVRR